MHSLDRVLSSATRFQTHFQFHSSKVRSYKPCTSTASESEFDHANRILRLKSSRASLYSVKVIKMSRLVIGYLFHGCFTGRFVVAKKTAQFFVLRHERC